MGLCSGSFDSTYLGTCVLQTLGNAALRLAHSISDLFPLIESVRYCQLAVEQTGDVRGALLFRHASGSVAAVPHIIGSFLILVTEKHIFPIVCLLVVEAIHVAASI